MSKFIKLTNFLLNANDIHKIVIQPNKYFIHIVSKQINGFNCGLYGWSIGNINSYTFEIEVCKEKNSIDYKILSDWINKI